MSVPAADAATPQSESEKLDTSNTSSTKIVKNDEDIEVEPTTLAGWRLVAIAFSVILRIFLVCPLLRVYRFNSAEHLLSSQASLDLVRNVRHKSTSR